MVPQVHTELPHPLSWSCYSKTRAYVPKSICFSKWDTVGKISAKMKTCYGADKRALWTTPHSILDQNLNFGACVFRSTYLNSQTCSKCIYSSCWYGQVPACLQYLNSPEWCGTVFTLEYLIPEFLTILLLKFKHYENAFLLSFSV